MTQNYRLEIMLITSVKNSQTQWITVSCKKFHNKISLTKWYNIYAKPVIYYEIQSYGQTSRSQLNRIFSLKKDILRTICFKTKFDSSNLFFSDLDIETGFDLFFKPLIKRTICHRPRDLFSYFACRRTTRAQLRGEIRARITKTTTQKRSLENSKNLLYNILIRLTILPMYLESLEKREKVQLCELVYRRILRDNWELLLMFFLNHKLLNGYEI